MATQLGHEMFSYKCLETKNHIRLLNISKKDGELIYELSHVDLALAPKYSALSYTWEDQKRDQDLLVNGSVLKVISNVRIALPYLFEKYHSQNFWIDGICINQDDNDEKEVQVPLMQKIYTQAAEGIVWLGESNPSIDQAITMIPTIIEKFQGYNYFIRGLDKRYLDAHGLPSPSSPVWAGINDLFSRGWFSRVWTFQEAVLPRTLEIMCGKHFVKFDDLVGLSRIMVRESGSLDSILGPVDHKTKLVLMAMDRVRVIQTARNQQVSQFSTAYTFLDLLYPACEWSCSNPSDKIYGLLGLADQSLQKQLTVDYSKTLVEVYLAFAECWIPRDTHLQLFHMASSNRMFGLPSWCPDFNSLPISSMFYPYAITAQYRAGCKVGRTSPVCFLAASKAVQVKGFRVDEIAEVVPCFFERQTNLTAELKDASIAELFEWDRKCLELSQLTYSTPQGVPDAHWRTIIANKHPDGQYYTGPGRETYQLTKIMLRAQTRMEIPLSPTEQLLATQPVTEEQLVRVQDFSKSFGYSSHGRAFFSTRGGRVGLGPRHTKSGDVVCIFYNGYTPYILRPNPEDPACMRNEFIGESYVDGLMYGEALSNEDKNLDEFFVLE